MSIHLYAMSDIESRDAAVRGMPGEVYENEVRQFVRCDWHATTRTWVVRKDRLGDLRTALDRAQLRYTQHETGTPPPALATPERAQYLVNAIKSGLAGLHPLVIEAYESRAWEPLGYTSWKALCEAEFALTLAIPQRREAVQQMSEAKMSTRAQADVLGVDQSTVVRDRQVMHSASPDSNSGSAQTAGLDGKTYPGRQTARRPVTWQDAAASTASANGGPGGSGTVEGVVLAPSVGQWHGRQDQCLDASIILLESGWRPSNNAGIERLTRLYRLLNLTLAGIEAGS